MLTFSCRCTVDVVNRFWYQPIKKCSGSVTIWWGLQDWSLVEMVLGTSVKGIILCFL